jgi:Domain of unknown function (DUF1707)
MSAPSGSAGPGTPAWLYAANRRRASYSNMRISDAERAEVADLLSAHYSDGRLDQAEFNTRLDQAMHAKTYAELGGLLADLPHTDGAPPAELQRQHGRSLHPFLVVAAVAGIALLVGHWLLSPFTAGPFGGFYLPWWVWVGGLAFLVLRFGPRRRQ